MGSFLQPHLQRSTIIFHNQNDLQSHIAVEIESEKSECVGEKTEHTGTKMSTQFPPIWSWRPTALTLYIGDIGKNSMIQSQSFQISGISNYLKLRRVQYTLVLKAVGVWGSRLAGLLCQSGWIPGPSKAYKTKGSEVLGRQIEYRSSTDDLLGDVYRVCRSRKTQRLVKMTLKWSRFHPKQKGIAIAVLIELLFKTFLKKCWKVEPNTLEWFVSALRANWDIRRINSSTVTCLSTILRTDRKIPRAQSQNG